MVSPSIRSHRRSTISRRRAQYFLQKRIHSNVDHLHMIHVKLRNCLHLWISHNSRATINQKPGFSFNVDIFPHFEITHFRFFASLNGRKKTKGSKKSPTYGKDTEHETGPTENPPSPARCVNFKPKIFVWVEVRRARRMRFLLRFKTSVSP